MTEEAEVENGESNATAPTADHDLPASDFRSQDWFLQELIELAEMGLEQGITLTIGGAQIHGNLIGGRRYFEAMVEALNVSSGQGERSELLSTISGLWGRHADVYPGPADERPPLGSAPANYIHLRDASWRSSSADPFPSNGTYWRGKVSAVDGFMLGTITTTRK
jgi:hypothetical protein